MNDSCAHCGGQLGDEYATITTPDREVHYCAPECLGAAHVARLDALADAVGLDAVTRRPAAARDGAHMWTAGYRQGRRDERHWRAGFLAGRRERTGGYLPSTRYSDV